MSEQIKKKERKKRVFEILRWDLRGILEMGFDQILKGGGGGVVVVVKLQRFEIEKRGGERERERKQRKERE